MLELGRDIPTYPRVVCQRHLSFELKMEKTIVYKRPSAGLSGDPISKTCYACLWKSSGTTEASEGRNRWKGEEEAEGKMVLGCLKEKGSGISPLKEKSEKKKKKPNGPLRTTMVNIRL